MSVYERHCRRVAHLALVLCFSLQVALPVRAQDGAIASAEPAPVPIIESAEVPARTEALRKDLRAIRERIEPQPRMREIEERLPREHADLASVQEQIASLIEEGASRVVLADVVGVWSSHRKRLLGWRRDLTRRAEGLESSLVELRAASELWQRSAVRAREGGAPREVLTAISENIAAISESNEQASLRRNTVLALLTTVSKLELSIEDALLSVRDAEAAYRGRIFQASDPPLWQALRVRQDLAGWPSGMRESLARDAAALRDFVRERIRSVPLLFLGLLLGVVATIAVRRRLPLVEGHPELSTTASVFARPASIAAIAAALGVIAWSAYLPASVLHLIGLLVVVPLVRVVAPTLPRSARPVLAAVAVFYLVDRVRGLAAPLELLERVLLLVQGVGGLLVVVALMRSSRLVVASEGAPSPTVGLLLRVGAAVLAVASVCNLGGYLPLARLATDGVFQSAYLGVATYAAYRISLPILLVAIHSRRANRIASVRNHRETLDRLAVRAAWALAWLVWARFTLGGFELLEPVERSLKTAFTTPLELGTLSISVVDVVALVATVALAVLLSRLVAMLLDDDVLPHLALGRGIGAAISATTRYLILLGGFFLALGAGGIDLSRFAILAGALGVGIGFGLQNVVNNFVSGLILLYERPVQVGDTVEVGALTGNVTRIGIRSSTVRTFSGSEVVVPNGNLISSELVNWTLSDPLRRVEIPVGVAYGSDHLRVLAVLAAAAVEPPVVLADPPPAVVFKGFGDSALDFEVRVWSRNEDFMASRTQTVAAIYSSLAEAGIQIPFPQRDLHFKSPLPDDSPQGESSSYDGVA